MFWLLMFEVREDIARFLVANSVLGNVCGVKSGVYILYIRPFISSTEIL
jgi:hypothetical protein